MASQSQLIPRRDQRCGLRLRGADERSQKFELLALDAALPVVETDAADTGVESPHHEVSNVGQRDGVLGYSECHVGRQLLQSPRASVEGFISHQGRFTMGCDVVKENLNW